MQFKIGEHWCEMDFCRGMLGKCRFSLMDSPGVHDRLRVLLERCGSAGGVGDGAGDVLPHKRVKMAFAACPNGCTLPHIKDVGFVAEICPRVLLESCDHCGMCVGVCRERAITMAVGGPEAARDKCVGCGMCMRDCPQQAIEGGAFRFAVLIGGRMGRHPRLADRMCVVGDRNLGRLVEKLLAAIDGHLNGNVRFADWIEQAGLFKVKEQVLYG